MKKIEISGGGSNKLHVQSLGDVYVASCLLREARENRLRVIESALSIEDGIDTIITWYFFPELREKRRIFKELVIDSDWCSFSAKRKVINHVINEQKLMEGSTKSEFERLLREVISFRNAFAHGDFHTDSKKVWLCYFEGGPREKELSDEYLSEVESIFSRAERALLDLQVKIGAIRVPQTNSPQAGPPST